MKVAIQALYSIIAIIMFVAFLLGAMNFGIIIINMDFFVFMKFETLNNVEVVLAYVSIGLFVILMISLAKQDTTPTIK